MAKRRNARVRNKVALASITAAGIPNPDFVRRDMERRRSSASVRQDTSRPRRTGSRSTAKAAAIRGGY